MSTNGKGSGKRQQSPAERKRFEDNYDAIFRRRGRVTVERVEFIPLRGRAKKLAKQLSAAIRREERAAKPIRDALKRAKKR